MVPATVAKVLVTILVAIGLLALALLDLDLAAKIAGLLACVLAIPAIWLSPKKGGAQSPSDPKQVMRGARSGRSIRQRSSKAATQDMTDIGASGDIEQSQ